MKDKTRHTKPLITHSANVRVLYKDTDQMGFVYYANYLVWFELGRAELMRYVGFPYQQVEALGVFLPVSRCSCNYKAPAHYDDLLRIETSVMEITDVSITFAYKIYRNETNELLTIGETKHAFVDSNGKLVRFGSQLFEHIKGFLASKSDCQEK